MENKAQAIDCHKQDKKEIYKQHEYRCVVIGVSAGGMNALAEILPELPEDFPLPIIVVQHLHPHQGTFHINYYNEICELKVKEADEKENIWTGSVYFAPPNYHLLIEHDFSFSLSIDPKVNFSRPAIDVLFKTAAEAFEGQIIGIVLTGANSDGALGLKEIKAKGGLTIVQTPETAEVGVMPESAIKATKVDFILPLNQIVEKLIAIVQINDKI